jgi:hypothetical protein
MKAKDALARVGIDAPEWKRWPITRIDGGVQYEDYDNR